MDINIHFNFLEFVYLLKIAFVIKKKSNTVYYGSILITLGSGINRKNLKYFIQIILQF